MYVSIFGHATHANVHMLTMEHCIKRVKFCEWTDVPGKLLQNINHKSSEWKLLCCEDSKTQTTEKSNQ